MSRARTQRENRELIARLQRDARRIALRFGLRYRCIEAERASVKRRYGICYSDGTIKIRLRNTRTGEPLKYSSLVATLCHELAHLRHFDHGEHFQRFNTQVLAWARKQGIYQPRRPRSAAAAPARPAGVPPRRVPVSAPPRAGARGGAAPVQLDLFG